MQERAVRLEIEAFDVEHAPVAGLHDHRDPTGACRLTEPDLHRQVVALLDQQIEPVEEVAEVVLVDPPAFDRHSEKWVELRDRSGSDDRLLESEVQHRRAHPVEVGQLDSVEVRQPKLSSDAFLRQRQRRRAPDREPRDAYLQGSKLRLLGAGDLVIVATRSQLVEVVGGEQVDPGVSPRIMHPHSVGVRV